MADFEVHIDLDGRTRRIRLARSNRVRGEEASVEAAAVLAIFNAEGRIADATGVPLEEAKARMSVDIREAPSLDD